MFNRIQAGHYEKDANKRFEKFKADRMKWQARKPLAIALITVIIFFGIYVGHDHFSGSYSNVELFDMYYKKYDTKSDKACRYLQAIKFYDEGKYNEAIQLFSKLTVNDIDQSQYSFYLAMSFMESNRYPDAINTLKEIAASNENMYYEKANWYLALCYLMTYNNQDAKKHFQLVTQIDEYYKDPALEILKTMGN